jgi:hypothetical protein
MLHLILIMFLNVWFQCTFELIVSCAIFIISTVLLLLILVKYSLSYVDWMGLWEMSDITGNVIFQTNYWNRFCDEIQI